MAHLFDIPAQGRVDKTPQVPLNIRAGMDSLSKIGEPAGAGQRQASRDQLFHEAINDKFPLVAESQQQA